MIREIMTDEIEREEINSYFEKKDNKKLNIILKRVESIRKIISELSPILKDNFEWGYAWENRDISEILEELENLIKFALENKL